MSETYEIHDVTDWPQVATEQMGTKRKFWCRHPDDYLTLFKQSRTHAGEHWSEKIAGGTRGADRTSSRRDRVGDSRRQSWDDLP